MSQLPEPGQVWEVELDIGAERFHSIVLVLDPYVCRGTDGVRAYPGFCLMEGRYVPTFMYEGSPLPESWVRLA